MAKLRGVKNRVMPIGETRTGLHGKEIASVVERRKECDSESAIRDRIEHAVTCCCQEQIPEKGKSPDPRCPGSEHDYGDGACQKSGEEQRMRESAMPPEIAVVDAESKPDHVEVGNNRADSTSDPHALWNLRVGETGSDAQGRDRV